MVVGGGGGGGGVEVVQGPWSHPSLHATKASVLAGWKDRKTSKTPGGFSGLAECHEKTKSMNIGNEDKKAPQNDQLFSNLPPPTQPNPTQPNPTQPNPTIPTTTPTQPRQPPKRPTQPSNSIPAYEPPGRWLRRPILRALKHVFPARLQGGPTRRKGRLRTYTLSSHGYSKSNWGLINIPFRPQNDPG